MKKYFNFIYLSCFTFLSYNQFVYADSGFRHLDQNRGQISCPLYKNRLISSLQRLNEFDYAEKIKNTSKDERELGKRIKEELLPDLLLIESDIE